MKYFALQFKHNKKAGFTLVETLIAVFLLTLTVGGLLTLAANGYFSVRYAKNQIIANNLMQEGLEYIRNDRDTAFQTGTSWDDWVQKYTTAACFTHGCMVDPYTNVSTLNVTACTNGNVCQPLTYYPDTGFYAYSQHDQNYPGTIASNSSNAYATTYVRTVTMEQSATDPNQVTVTVSVAWLNGQTKEKKSQSILITNWHLTQS